MENPRYNESASKDTILLVFLLIIILFAISGFITIVDSNSTWKTKIIRACAEAGQFQHESTVVKCEVVENKKK